MNLKNYLKIFNLGRFHMILPKVLTKNILFNDGISLSDKFDKNYGITTDLNSSEGFMTDFTVTQELNNRINGTHIRYIDGCIELQILGTWFKWKYI